MLKEAYSSCAKTQEQDKITAPECSGTSLLLQVSILSLLSMAIGTSIDALAVGVSYVLVSNSIMLCASIIGVVCFVCSLIGYFLGQIISKFKAIDPTLNILGSLVLIGIGINILIDHQAFEQIALWSM